MKFNSIDKAFKYVKNKCITNGELLTDERGDKLYQLPIVSFTFSPEVHKHFHEINYLNIPDGAHPEMINNYSEQLKSKDLQGFVYTYGHRFQTHFSVDQYEYIIKKLQDNPHSRRAIAITIDPKVDTQIDDIPCLQEIVLAVQNDKLFMTVFFRSNDIKYAFKYNMYGLLKLHQMFSEKLGYPVGDFNYVCCNPHYKLI